MKKILAFLTLFSFLFFAFASANVDEGDWSYVFHLQMKNGTLGVNTDASLPYDPVPMLYTPNIDPTTSDFYGVILNSKNKEIARFGFEKPNQEIVALNKAVADVHAPFFAYAEVVNFYAQGGTKPLFSVSVKGSSFCNEDRTCNANVGEDYKNCPMDCSTPEIVTIIEETAVSSSTPPSAINSNSIEELLETTTATTGGVITKTEPVTKKFEWNAKTIISLTGGVILVLLGVFIWRIRKNME